MGDQKYKITDLAYGMVPPESRLSGWLLRLVPDIAIPKDEIHFRYIDKDGQPQCAKITGVSETEPDA